MSGMDVGLCSKGDFQLWQECASDRANKYADLLSKEADCRKRGDKAGEKAARREARVHWFGEEHVLAEEEAGEL